jgi:hypothetical protein
LLDISEESFSIHSSFDHHRGHDTGVAEASDECQRFPMSHWNLANKAFPARAPAVGTDHVGGDGSFIDKYKANGVKQPLLADPTSALPRHVFSVSLCGAQAFFNSDAMTSEKSGERAAASRISSSVRSGCSLALERKDLGRTPPMAKCFRRVASVRKSRPRESVAST